MTQELKDSVFLGKRIWLKVTETATESLRMRNVSALDAKKVCVVSKANSQNAANK